MYPLPLYVLIYRFSAINLFCFKFFPFFLQSLATVLMILNSNLVWRKIPLLGNCLVVVEGLACSNYVSGYTSGKCYTHWQILSCWPGTHGETRQSVPPSPRRATKMDANVIVEVTSVIYFWPARAPGHLSLCILSLVIMHNLRVSRLYVR